MADEPARPQPPDQVPARPAEAAPPAEAVWPGETVPPSEAVPSGEAARAGEAVSPGAARPPVESWADVAMPGLGDADALHDSLEEIRRTLDTVENGLAGIRAGRRSGGRGATSRNEVRSRSESWAGLPVVPSREPPRTESREVPWTEPREWPVRPADPALGAEPSLFTGSVPHADPAPLSEPGRFAEPAGFTQSGQAAVDQRSQAPSPGGAIAPGETAGGTWAAGVARAAGLAGGSGADDRDARVDDGSGTVADLRGGAIAHAPVGRHRRLRRPWVAGLVAGLVLVALVVLAMNLLGRREPAAGSLAGSLDGASTQAPVAVAGASDAAAPGSASAAAGSAAGPGIASTDVEASTAAAGPPLLWPGSSTDAPSQLVTTGPGVDAPGTDVVAAPGAGGEVDVYERVVVRAPDPAGLRLALPDLTKVSTLTVGSDLVLTDLRITADGRPVNADPFAGHWVIQGRDGQAVTRAVLRYRMAGALVQHEQSLPRRALILVAPLSAAVSRAGGAPVVVRADRVQVRDMTCPLAPTAQVLCGSGGRPAWVATVPASSTIPLVLLQVDLAG